MKITAISAIVAGRTQWVAAPIKLQNSTFKYKLPLTRDASKAHDFETADNARDHIRNSDNNYSRNYDIERMGRPEEVETKPAVRGDRFSGNKGKALADSKAFRALPIIIGFVITMYLINRREPSPPPAPAHAFYVLDRSLDFAE